MGAFLLTKSCFHGLLHYILEQVPFLPIGRQLRVKTGLVQEGRFLEFRCIVGSVDQLWLL